MRLLITSSRMPFPWTQRKQLFVAMSDWITRDGQPIPGLPADAAASWSSSRATPARPGRAAARMAAMDRSVLWRAALAQLLTVAALSVLLAVALPDSFFDDWGWLTGPLAWLACAALTARALNLDVRGVLLGALLAGIPSAIAVLAGVHWLGVAIAVAAFAAWCGWLARRPEGALWT